MSANFEVGSRTIPPLTSLSLSHPLAKKAERHFGLGTFQKITHEPWGAWGVCYWNAKERARLDGGERVLGWQLLIWPKAFIMAVHHAIWRSPQGVLIDVTKKLLRDSKPFVTFVVDDSIVLASEDPPLVPNKRFLLSQRAQVLALVEAEFHHQEYKRTLYSDIQAAGFHWDHWQGFGEEAAHVFHERFVELRKFYEQHRAASSACIRATQGT